jgi:ATP-dependent DNA helicase RecG
MSDLEFLDHWGFLVHRAGSLLPSRASVLLFGMDSAFRQVLPRPVIDCQNIDSNLIDSAGDNRWSDRLVIEQNLIESWRSLLDWYMKHAERPFRVDSVTLQREDAPPDYIAFREASINLLIHQDYSDDGRKPVLQVFRDNTRFWNPGESFASTDELLDPGEKEVRNPRIVNAFRRIGLSEQAGTGVRAIFRSWQQLGHVPPLIRNEKERHAFELVLPREPLLSEEQLLFQARLGVRLTETEAKVFAYACREGGLRVQDVRMVANVSARDAAATLERLTVQALISPVDKSGNYFLIAEHLRPRLVSTDAGADQASADAPNLVSDQPPGTPPRLVTDQAQMLTALSETQWKIVALCDVPQAMAVLMERLGLTHRTFFRRTHLDPLVRGGVLRLTHPEQPNHPNQAYVLTVGGVEIKARRLLTRNETQD